MAHGSTAEVPPSRPPVQDMTCVLDGLQVHYRDWGSPETPPLVLLHAYTSHARSWDTFAQQMADRFHVLALDLRGHGESDHASDYMAERVAGDLEAFVEMLDLRRLSIVGFSAGGGAACTYAARHPERVDRLVMAENFTGGGPEALAHLTILRSLPEVFDAPEEAAAAFRPLALYAPEAELRHWMRSGLSQRPDDRWAWRYDPVFRQPGPPGRLAPVASALLDSLAQVTCPILLVVGAESFGVESAERMASANPHTRLAHIARAGHWVPLDNPEAFGQVVRDFLLGM
jgi:pimeloyl-ACP methyl ester carboxylesterase